MKTSQGLREMPVKNFECHIARGQIGRYVGGESLSKEALRQLGLHVAECDDCRDHLERRKQALQAMVNGTLTPEATAPTFKPSGSLGAAAAAEALVEQIRRKTGDGLPLQDAKPKLEPEPTPAPPEKKAKILPPLLGKPAMFSVALAAVLIAMGYISKNPSAILGSRVKVDSSKATSSSETKAEPEKPATDSKSSATTKTDAPVSKEPVGHGPLAKAAAPDDSLKANPAQAPTDTTTTPATEPTTKPTEQAKAENLLKAPATSTAPSAPAPTKQPAPAPATKSAAKPQVKVHHGRRHHSGTGSIVVYHP